ncbi:hypothetical protein NH340_JMT02006 [Sarcoptes scabiei]|nr:hypothetical protein NH340_JMT02006 [Sarcoptes scabiei]
MTIMMMMMNNVVNDSNQSRVDTNITSNEKNISKQEQFISDLVQFYRNKGISSANSCQFVARLDGKNVNLHQLYSFVVEYGGSYKVNQFNLWEEIYCKLFKSDCIGANFAVALRQIYNRYLLQYEKSSNGNAFNNEQWNEDDEDENAIFANTSNQTRNSILQQNSFSDESAKQSNSQNHHKLYCSLLSGLPNELEFALNVVTILNNSHRFDWTNDFKFINVLLESIKSYCCVCYYFEEQSSFGKSLHTDEDEVLEYQKSINSKLNLSTKNLDKRKNSGLKLNGDCCDDDYMIGLNDDDDDEDVNCLEDNNELIKKACSISKLESSRLENDAKRGKPNGIFTQDQCNCYVRYWSQTCLDRVLLEEIFVDENDYCSRYNQRTRNNDMVNIDSLFVLKEFPIVLLNKIERKIGLIADILRNISFTFFEKNPNNVSMSPLLRFLILLLNSDNIRFVNTSLDILSNIAPALSCSSSLSTTKRANYNTLKNSYRSLLQILLKKIVNIAFNSNNIHDVTKCFEIMARFISSTNTEANNLLEKNFDCRSVQNKVAQLLTCHYDIGLILALLEFCLAISECRPQILINNDNKILLKILINLLNCEASKHFTTGALQKIKIIDTRPNDNQIIQTVVASDAPKPPQTIQQAQQQLPSANSQQQPQQAIPINITIAQPQQLIQPAAIQQQPSQQAPIDSNVQQIALNLNTLDNESFALHWLRTNYEERSNISIKIADIYAEYVTYCCRNSRRNVIAAQSFNFLLKRCFPTTTINNTLIDGLAIKMQQNQPQLLSVIDETGGKKLIAISNNTNNQMSPILKAHLSTPPKAPVIDPIPKIVPTPSNSSQSTSTLIKSLLANKLRNNQQQQQQQQQIQSLPQQTIVQTPTIVNTNQITLASNKNPELVPPISDNINQSPSLPLQQQKNIIIANNPSTSFALTPTLFSNNLIVPSPIQSSPANPLPGSQQIFLVRTFITGPDQQNNNTPVRLLVPASMLAQQRLPFAPQINGMSNSTGLINAVTSLPNAPNIIQTQRISASPMANSVPVIVSSSNMISSSSATNQTKPSSVANSSPLLNVLLDKGKLPDFSMKSAPPTSSSQPINPINTNTKMALVATNNPPVVQNQPKMFILAQNPPKPNIPILTSTQSSELLSKLSNVNVNTENRPSIPIIVPQSNSIVNGDIKSIVNQAQTVIANASVKQNLDLKSSMPELNKRLKINPDPKTDTSVISMVQINTQSSIQSSQNLTQSSVNNNSIVVSNANQNESKKTSNVCVTSVNNNPPTPSQNQVNVVNNSASVIVNNSQTSMMNGHLDEMECLWNNCQKKFSRPSDVFYHVHSQHIMVDSCPQIMNCLWGGSEGRGPGCLSKRPKLSLLTHLQDFHCNPSVLKQESLRKQQLMTIGSSSIVLPQPPAHPGYGQNAAMLAIRRQTTKLIESKESFNSLTPLTVSIRLTSALILRNLAQSSQIFKKSLELFEQQLCEISVADDRDESKTIAQCLAVINENR